MRHDLRLTGVAFGLRPVEPADAAAIVELRSDPGRSRFLHATDPSVAAQERWLEEYFGRDDDCYFAVHRLSDGSTEGFVGIYDVAGTEAEWGRWVLRPGSLAAPESAWLVHEIGFGPLGLDVLVSRTLAENRAVVAFHARAGAETVRTIPGHAVVGGVPHDAVEARMTRASWLCAGPALRASAERTAALLRRSAPR